MFNFNKRNLFHRSTLLTLNNKRPLLEVLSWIAGIIGCIIAFIVYISNFTFEKREDTTATDMLFNKGKYFLENNLYDSAIYYFNKVTLVSPRRMDACFLRGYAYHQKGNYNFAVQDYTNILNNQPKNIEALIARGKSYYYLNQYGKGLIDLNAAHKIDSNNINVLSFRGLCLIRSHDVLNARTDFVRAVELEPNDPILQFNLGLYYSHTEFMATIMAAFKVEVSTARFDSAIDCFSNAIRLNDLFADAWYMRGRSKLKKYLFENQYTPAGQLTHFDTTYKFELAIENFDRALELKPDFREALYYRGVARSGQHKDFLAAVDIVNAEKMGVKLDSSFKMINDRFDFIK